MEAILNTQFQQLEDIIGEILKVKKSGQNSDTLRTAAALKFVALKHANREVKQKIKSERDNLHLEKCKVDISRLQLQNLLYEVSHLKKDIVRCEKFQSRDSKLVLLSDTEYFTKLPGLEESKVKPESEHHKHLQRLECELRLRKDLDKQKSSLKNSKKELQQENLKQHNRYVSFAPALRTLKSATKPLHDALQLSLDVEWKLSAVVKYLPKPLYILFINLQCLQRASDEPSFNVEVVGYESEAQMQELTNLRQNPKARRDYSERDIELSGKPEENPLNKELSPHPLHIRITLGSAGSIQLVLIIRYFEQIKCATVWPQLSISNNTNHQGDTNFVQHLLRHLFANDLGNEIPIPGIQYDLQNKDLTPQECIQYLESKDFGKAYCWLQSICSIPTVNSSMLYKHELNLNKSMRETIARITRRWNSWLNLSQQIRGLTNKDIDLYVLKENVYPAALSCSLVQWTAITLEEFLAQNSDVLNISPDDKGITYNSYRAVIVRGSAKMECFIRIPSNYPLEMPLWILSVHWNGRRTSQNNAAIKMMEYWTNSLQPQHLEANYRILYAQLFRTIYSFDIFLETEGSMQTTIEYTKEKPYISAFAKRCRLRPYKYIKKGSVHAFKQ
ncbi:THO complex subunit 5 isoform X1 [Drosophila miranda]|uniref:THO complex subunit 5 isoform X1 n=1 Tax=Drosophila miranda TaxID=7229 RepID=UPI00143F0E0A|nr:THO complex subunit 5 isoform X1 [Drosophila miranda]